MKKRFLLFTFLTGLMLHIQAKEYNVVKFGAKNDTTKLSTLAINKAIEHCYQKGGGRVVIPAGNYKSGTITLKDNVELYLAQGAILYASTKHEDLPRQKQPEYRSQKDPGGWYSLIYAEKAKNIAVCGPGTIDGQGARQLPRPECLKGDKDGRPRNILFISCKGVRVDELTMRNSGIWNQHYLDCEDVRITRQRVWNHCNRNNDALDLDGCRRVIVSDCIYDSGDDGITLKSTGAAACEDVSISNCVVSTHCNAIKCGTETTGGFRNISISNCVIKPSRSGKKFAGTFRGRSGIALEIVDGGVMEGVTVNNISIEGTECPLFVRLANRARKHTKDAPVPSMGEMRNISISNIVAYNTGNYTSSITAIEGAVIENISLSNIQLINMGDFRNGKHKNSLAEVHEGAKSYPTPNMWGNLPCSGLFVRHVKDIRINNIYFGSRQKDSRPVILLDDVEQMDARQISFSSNTNPKVLTNRVRQVKLDGNLTVEKLD